MTESSPSSIDGPRPARWLALLGRMLTRIAHLGTSPEMPPDERRALVATNVACPLLLLLISPFPIVFAAFGAWPLFALSLGLCFVYVLTLVLMWRGLTVLARFLLLTSINGCIFVFCILLGEHSHLETAFFFGLMAAFLFFSARHPGQITLAALLPVVAYTVLRIGAYDWYEPYGLSEAELRIFTEMITPITALLTLLPGFILLREQVAAERGLTRDVAALKRAEDEIRRLSERSSQDQEEERRRLAHLLHDGAAQTLVAASLWAHDLARHETEVQQPGFRTLSKLLDDVQIQLRELSHDLRPAGLDTLGLGGALLELTQHYSSSSCAVTYRGPIDMPFELPEEIGITLYRVAQSALANVLRHSGARDAEVLLDVRADVVALEIRDEGHGFKTSSPAAQSGLGLVGMRERVTWLGGSFSIDSTPGAGTRIAAAVPLHRGGATERVTTGSA